jgi:hypothetical protein
MDNQTILPPATVAIRAFGGVRPAARLLNCDASTVSRWQKSGRVPSIWQRRVLELAWHMGIDLTAHDLVMGRSA